MWRAVDSEGEVLEILVLGRELRAPRRKPVRRVLDRIEAAWPILCAVRRTAGSDK